MIWQGWLDTRRIATRPAPAPPGSRHDMVMGLEVYVGERDVLGVGSSDNVILRDGFSVARVQG